MKFTFIKIKTVLFLIFPLLISAQKDTVITSKKPNQNSQLLFYVSYEIKYPEQAKKNNVEGVVKLSYDIDSSCTITNKKIIDSLGYGCEEEAMRVLGQYEDGLKKHNRYTCEPMQSLIMPVKFKLPAKK